ncbi:hypothetical protein C4580_01405 [Candidatus Woesearchaeota archaeon]|nr:MAG: hypothetical protein C4580_01405 [Candidatus Woesearchaeota archaeon]
MAYLRGSWQRHEELKAELLANPELLGIAKKDVIEIQEEYPLSRRKRTVFARPDLSITYRCERGICRTFVEIKSGNCKRARQNLAWQLAKINKFIRHHNLHASAVGVCPSASGLELIVL